MKKHTELFEYRGDDKKGEREAPPNPLQLQSFLGRGRLSSLWLGLGLPSLGWICVLVVGRPFMVCGLGFPEQIQDRVLEAAVSRQPQSCTLLALQEDVETTEHVVPAPPLTLATPAPVTVYVAPALAVPCAFTVPLFGYVAPALGYARVQAVETSDASRMKGDASSVGRHDTAHEHKEQKAKTKEKKRNVWPTKTS